MRNANLRIRCISEETLESIIELLTEESNAIYIESWETQEDPRTGDTAQVIYGVNDAPRTGLGSQAGNRSNRPRPRARTRT